MKRRELKIEPIYRNCSMFFQKLPKWGMIQEKNVIAREKREEESTSNISLFPKKKKEDKASFCSGSPEEGEATPPRDIYREKSAPFELAVAS